MACNFTEIEKRNLIMMENKEKVIRKLVEFCKKAENDTTTEERRDTITSTAEELVKLFAIPVVMQRSELLLFADYSESDKTSQTTDECVDNYLAQKSNSA